MSAPRARRISAAVCCPPKQAAQKPSVISAADAPAMQQLRGRRKDDDRDGGQLGYHGVYLKPNDDSVDTQTSPRPARQ